MKLVIIEGEGKRETINKYLKGIDSSYNVIATKGHVRDLPEHTLAVDIKNNFEPKYVLIPKQKEIIKQLKEKASQAESILLATDPDREGEAISWHLTHILGIPPESPCRIVFNEISKTAVQNALQNPRPIDKNLVDAQQARRVLDRLVGYKLSPIISKKIRSKLSAGRVQSVALKLVVDREREIRAFVPKEYWHLKAVLEKDNVAFLAKLASHKDQKLEINNKAEMDKVLDDLKGAQYLVTKIKRGVTKVNAPAPYTTSTMQQDALNKLGISLKVATACAQNLYEGVELGSEGKVALVTYIRTDSTRISPEAQKMAEDYIKSKFGTEYYPETPNKFKSKKGIQDAHEAIRPISLDRTPESVKPYLNRNLYRLYKLIYERFLASQMAQAQYDTVSAEITANDYRFTASGRTLKFKGFLAAYSADEQETQDKPEVNDDEDDSNKILPPLEEGDKPKLIELKPEQKFTKPPARYTEASLVKAMEEKGIGRPATYTPTILILFTREYCEKEGRHIKPTELGEQVTDMLVRYFPDIMSVDFTANMENMLDEIEEGGKVWQQVIHDFYFGGFERDVKAALEDSFTLKQPDEQSDVVCENCGVNMVIRHGRYGKFLACPNFPKCRNTKSLEEESEKTSIKCEKCGGDMVVKHSKYGKFLGCSNYPKCQNIKPIEDENADYGKCPKCGKPLVKRRSRRGEFFACSGYPDCRFISNDKVVDQKCPQCDSHMVLKHYKDGDVIKCASKECGYTIKIEENGHNHIEE
ncbi:MAG TPA: type I DNA topoisomerase [Clostridia bacterium]